MRHPTAEDIAIVNGLGALGEKLWGVSTQVVLLNTDPRAFSVMLYRRLWSNYRGYTVLWGSRLQTEADIILRSGLEAAICIAANYVLREEFVRLTAGDMLATLQGQMKLARENGDLETVRAAEQALEGTRNSPLLAGATAKMFQWKTLAKAGGVPQFYDFHKQLSGHSSHVTGLSLMNGVVGASFEGQDDQDELSVLTRNGHLMMMAGAMALASQRHAAMIEASECEAEAGELIARLNAASAGWLPARA